jgi:hypothetical protein
MAKSKRALVEELDSRIWDIRPHIFNASLCIELQDWEGVILEIDVIRRKAKRLQVKARKDIDLIKKLDKKGEGYE